MTAAEPRRAAASDAARVELEIDVRLPLDRFELEVSFVSAAPSLGVFGASGAGKTSLLEVIAGLRRARGRVRCGDEVWLDDRRDLGPQRRRIGYVPQDGLLFPHWTVRRNLLAGAARARAAGLDPSARVDDVVDLLELGSLLERLPPTLSGGERQRVALGRALCSGPRLLLLDEPLSALDLPLRRRLLPFLRRIRAELTVPMLLVTHDPVEAQALCDELVVLRRGRVVAHGAPRRLLADPAVFSVQSPPDGGASSSFETVLPARLHLRADGAYARLVADGERDAAGGVVGDGESRVELMVRSPRGLGEGASVLLGLRADDLLLAVEPPRGLSARNIVPARVVDVLPADTGSVVRVALAPGVPAVAVELATGTADELALAPGRAVFLVVKASAVRILGGG